MTVATTRTGRHSVAHAKNRVAFDLSDPEMAGDRAHEHLEQFIQDRARVLELRFGPKSGVAGDVGENECDPGRAIQRRLRCSI